MHEDSLISKSAAHLATLSDAALKEILLPLFPAVRTPLLPSMKILKESSEYRFVKGMVAKHRQMQASQSAQAPGTNV